MLRAKTLLLVTLLAVVVAACGGGLTTADKKTPPTTPTGLTAMAAGVSMINLSWNASTDDVGVTSYIVLRDGTQAGTPVTTSYADTGLSAGTTYSYTVAARDAAGSMSDPSTNASATTAGTGTGTGDTTPPTAPANLTATVAGASVINLSWDPSTDNVGVTGYIVRRNGTPVATPVTTSYADTGLSAGTTYRYTVAARDAAGNSWLLSTYELATTTGTPPTPPPAIPSALGWFQIPNTRLASFCAVNQGFPGVAGIEGCTAITESWSGGVFDTTRNRLVIWGGGHGAYAGNEVYALDLNTLTMARLNDPSTSLSSCTGTYPDGKPVSRHTYNHLAYLPNQDAMFAWGGSQWQCGSQADDTWLLNFPALSWTRRTNGAGGPVGNQFGVSAAYDPNSGLVYAHSDLDLFTYNPATNIWTRRGSANIGQYKGGGVIDPARKKYFLHQNGSATLYWYGISNPTASVPPQSGQTTGCSGLIGIYNAGMEYDPIQNRIVGWNGGDTVYILNPDTLSCTTVSFPGGPADVANGTFGRFRYSPALNVFVVCNSVNANCHTLRLTP